MGSWNKNDITILLPCYNEGQTIAATVRVYKNLGFSHVLVVDDHSVDDTGGEARRAGARVIRNSSGNGYLLTVLRGLYSIGKGSVLIIDADGTPDEKSLNEFLEFGFLGKHGLLFSRTRPGRERKLTKYLEKRFGLFISDPDFQTTFVGKELLSAVKDGASMTEQYLFLNLIVHAINAKQKIGSYRLTLTRPNYTPIPTPFYARLHRPRSWSNAHGHFFKYALPDSAKNEARRSLYVKIIVAVASSALTVLAFLLKQWLVPGGKG